MILRRKSRKKDQPNELEWSFRDAVRSEAPPGDGWVRLFADHLLEAEEACGLGLDPLTGEKSFEIDRKLSRDISLFRVLGSQIYVSDAFLDYLIRARVTGLSGCILVPHFAPNKVNGRPFYRILIEGELGTIHKSTRTKPRHVEEEDVERFPDLFKREIFEPVTIDGANWSGHDLCWSSQSFAGLHVWRALFIRVEVLQRIQPPTDLYLNPVNVVNLASPKRMPVFVAPEFDVPEVPPRRSIAEVWAELIPSDFTEPPKRESVKKLLAELAAVGLDGVAEVVDLMQRANGATLFEMGLIFATVGDRERSLPALKAEEYGFEIPAEWSKFAYGHCREISWCCNREGKVRGFGQEGITYGPNVSVAEWFSDQVVDLRWARKQGGKYGPILGL